MGRKSRGRGRHGPMWEVQCKQSVCFNHPGSRSGLDTLWCSPRAAPPPSHPRLPSNCAQPFGETCWYQPQSVVGPSRYGEAEGQWQRDQRMWSGAGLTGVQSITWKAFIITDVFQETAKGQDKKHIKGRISGWFSWYFLLQSKSKSFPQHVRGQLSQV